MNPAAIILQSDLSKAHKSCLLFVVEQGYHFQVSRNDGQFIEHTFPFSMMEGDLPAFKKMFDDKKRTTSKPKEKSTSKSKASRKSSSK